jgi:hypothetical protein
MATGGNKRILIAMMIILLGISPGLSSADDFAVALYAGQLTKEKWENSILPGAEFADASIVVASASWTYFRLLHGSLSFELEGQLGKYFGEQDNWEINMPILGFRWHRFPWDDHLATTIAWGIGSSYATQVPKVELETNYSSNKWLIYWFLELTFGPPTKNWEVLMRLHHRSDGFGLVAEDGGSNAVCTGLRYRF